jgi:hypothetical protein
MPITSANQLGELLNLVHDRWFDAEHVALDKERKTVAIHLEENKADLAKGSKDGIRLLIRNAEALTVNDTEKVRDRPGPLRCEDLRQALQPHLLPPA